MIQHPSRMTAHRLPALAVLGASMVLAACTGVGTKLQAPTASIQQLTVQSDGTWVAVVRIQNLSYDTGMHVFGIDAALSLDGEPAGHIALSPSLDIPAMDADTATATFRPEPGGPAALAAVQSGAVAYELKGTLSVARDWKGKPQPFDLDGKGFISPVPGVSNIWR